MEYHKRHYKHLSDRKVLLMSLYEDLKRQGHRSESLDREIESLDEQINRVVELATRDFIVEKLNE